MKLLFTRITTTKFVRPYTLGAWSLPTNKSSFFKRYLSITKRSGNFLRGVYLRNNTIKTEKHEGVYITRITDPLNNIIQGKEEFVKTVSEIMKKATGCTYLDQDFLTKQLRLSKEVIFVWDVKTHEITHFFRHDVYTQLPFSPHAFAVFGIPGAFKRGITHKVVGNILLNELEQKLTPENTDPKLLLIARTFNPKVYQMRLALSENTYPNIVQFKRKLDEHMNKKLLKLIDDGELELVRQLLTSRLLIIDSRLIYDFDIGKLKLLLTANQVTVDLRNIKVIFGAEYNNSAFFQQLHKDIIQLYLSDIPLQYQEVMARIIKNYYSPDAKHDYNFFVAKNALPWIKHATNLGVATNPIINDFFEGILDRRKNECLLFCTEVSYQYLKQNLLKSRTESIQQSPGLRCS